MIVPSAAERDAAVSTLAVLNAQADAVRLELARLQRQLAILQVQHGEDYVANLQQANEQLLVSALNANAIAARAEEALADVLRIGQGGVSSTTQDRALALERLDSAVAMARDKPLSDLREANERLVIAALTADELRNLAEEAHGQQIKFMALVAHELRNPLTPIKLAAGMLGLANADSTRLAKLQGIIEDQVRHMMRLVDDLLDGSRIRTGKLRLHLSKVELADVVQMAVDICRARAASKCQKIEAHLPASNVFVSGDNVRLTQVFSNLLDNASKYTPAGGHIALAMDIREGDAIVTISDDGCGIAAEMLPHIFDLFVQEPGDMAVRNGGLGIGLAVVRELVNAHGGTVAAQSAGRGQGSQFIVTLPLMAASSNTAWVAPADSDAGLH